MAADEFSWEDPLRSYVDTWQRVVFTPRDFFASASQGSGLQGPIGFLLVTLALGGAGLALTGWGAAALPLLLVGGLLRVLAAAFLAWLIATQVFSGKGDYQATLRVLAYASAVAVFVFVPGVRLLAKLYALFLAIVGLEKAHQFDAVSAVLTLLLAALVAVALTLGLGLGHLFHPAHPAWLLGA